ncbi:MAG: FkbM family methyltransferase [Pontixanthobacter sp.]
MESVKKRLVGTSLGRWLSSAREIASLITIPRVALGTVVNDQLALRLLAQLCRPNDVFVDIGAHIGSVIAEVRHNCPDARIVAFEAMPDKAAWLTAKFPAVEVHCCALSDRTGEAEFFINLDQSGYSSLAEQQGSVDRITVEMKRIDDMLDQADLIKIDVEGAELGVLRGAVRLIERCQPLIMFESGPGNVLGFTKEGMFEFFAERGYGLLAPNRLAHTGGAMTLDGFLDSHEYPRRTTNYYAVPMGRFDEFRARAAALFVR